MPEELILTTPLLVGAGVGAGAVVGEDAGEGAVSCLGCGFVRCLLSVWC